MTFVDGVNVRFNSRRPSHGRAVWDGLVRVVCFVLGVIALCVVCVCAICLLLAIEDNRFRQIVKPLGGLVFLASGGTYLAFKSAFKRTTVEYIVRHDPQSSCGTIRQPFTDRWTVTEDEIEALAARLGQPWQAFASRLTTLSPELARKLVESGRLFDLDLNCLRSLSRESAQLLAQHNGPLSLNGLRTISEEVAEGLSHHQGWLYLDGLTELTPAVAAHLARHRHTVHLGDFYNRLSLNGVTSLSEDTAAGLARFLGNLRLNGLETVTPEAARHLATHMADAHWGVGELYSLMLDGVTTLSDESAAALANYRGGLSLDGLVQLSSEALRALAHHRGNALSFGRLASMPDDVAALFGSQSKRIFLSSLREVSSAGLAALKLNPNVILPDGDGGGAKAAS